MNRREFLTGTAACALAAALPVPALVKGALKEWRGMRLIYHEINMNPLDYTGGITVADAKHDERLGIILRPIADNQEPLGSEFAAIWDDNVVELFEA